MALRDAPRILQTSCSPSIHYLVTSRCLLALPAALHNELIIRNTKDLVAHAYPIKDIGLRGSYAIRA